MTRTRRALKFTRRDVTRLIDVVRESGLPIARVDVSADGAISVITSAPASDAASENPWDAAAAKAEEAGR